MALKNLTRRRPDGYARVSSPDGVEEFDSIRCCHCGTIFHFVPGSGTKRGFCMKCNEITCGAEGCMTCIPLEARLDHMEGKTTPYTGVILDQFGRKAAI